MEVKKNSPLDRTERNAEIFLRPVRVEVSRNAKPHIASFRIGEEPQEHRTFRFAVNRLRLKCYTSHSTSTNTHGN